MPRTHRQTPGPTAPSAWRWRSVCAAGLLLLFACGGEKVVGPANLLLVILDTTRADHLGCYGYARDTTPTLDALAARGVRFAAASAQSSLTPVSAGSFLSGSWPFRSGIRSLFAVEEQSLSAEVPSLFELLSSAGRQTAAFVSARPMGAHYGLDRGFALYEDDLGPTARRYGIEAFGDAPQRPADETTDLALAWLAEHGAEPFAVMVHYFDAHDHYFLPPRAFLEGRVSFPLPADLGRLRDVERHGRFYDLAHWSELYDAEISFMDLALERLLAELSARGLLEDTLVCVIADHGEAFGEHGFYTHGLLYEEQLRVPFILAGPGLPDGRVVTQTVRLVDLLPTVAELCGLELQRAADGTSLLPLIRGLPAEEDLGEVYAEVHHAREDRLRRAPAIHSLALGPWKYVTYPDSGGAELFNLEEDPAEIENLYSKQHPMAVFLRKRLEAWGALSGGIPQIDAVPEAELETLRELGYL